MIRTYSFWCLLATAIFYATGTIAHESMIGSERGNINKFPYQVALTTLNGGRNICGGGIIAEQFIITAAHCVIGDDNQFRLFRMAVLAGSDNLHNTLEPAVVIEVKKIYVPREFVLPHYKTTGDIAVIKLKKPLDFKRHIHLRKLRLPKSTDEFYDNKVAKVAGFGWNWVKIKNNQKYGNNSDGYLRFAEADIIDHEQCQLHHPVITISAQSEKFLCAKAKQDLTDPTATCTGDSGSPLVDDQSTVIGILSFGPSGCREAESSAIYTRVSEFLTFIRDAMRDRTKNLRSFELFL